MQLARPVSRLRAPAIVLLGSALLTASAWLVLPMWPVPMSMQPFAVLLVGLCCGARLGLATVAAYLLEAACGLPVLAAGHALLPLAPSSGYLLGFALAVAAVGALADRGWCKRADLLAVALGIGMVLIYLPGLVWLRVAWMSNWHAVLAAGLLPFLPGDLIKAAVALLLVRRVAR
jgi:biotin transport system substrate-specific component